MRQAIVIRQLYEMFSPVEQVNKQGRAVVQYHKKKVLAAQGIAKLEGASRCTINRARKALDIKPKRIAGKHYWKSPTRTLQEALDYINLTGSDSTLYKAPTEDKKRFDIQAEQVGDYLEDLFREYKYEIPSRDFKKALRGITGRTYQWGVICAARKRKQVYIYREDDGHWNLVFPAQEVADWLASIIEGKEQAFAAEDIYKQAMKEKGWSRMVVATARRLKVPNIQVYYKDGGKAYWYDFGYYTPPEVYKRNLEKYGMVPEDVHQ